MFLKKIFAFVFAASLLMSTGCSEETTPTTPPATAGQARVIAVHASPNAPAVDLLVDGAVAGTNLAFRANTNYLPVNAGSRTVALRASGAPTSAPIDPTTLPLEANRNYTVLAVDSLSRINLIALADDLTAPAAGKAHVRFVHASPNAPAVDISTEAQPAGVGVFTNRSFVNTQAAATAVQSFTPVDAGTLTLQVRAAGTAPAVLTIPDVTLQAGKIYTIYARGFLGGTGDQALGASIVPHN
jgi:hypothetical protein